ncbi:MAG: type VI secretion system baseplate subunit TssG [Candidatus Accumulibacter sp.]|jgi:type VI secretion system protein ImpH|nr:type VI secretion system baseplate subunit TssG [Accumulibacter sp.]
MAAPDGRKTTAIKESLRESPERFSLVQALRLLTMELEAQGFTSREAEQRVGIVPWLSLAWPPSEVTGFSDETPLADGAARPRASRRYTLETPLIGLYSTQGPLPTLYTEELLDEARAGQSTVKDFLDILNNRLAHYYCRVELHYNHPRRLIEYGDDEVELVLNSIMGQAYPGLRFTKHPHPLATELLLGPRTAENLAAYLAFELDWPHINIEECVPRRARIPEDQRCRVGQANARVGEDLFLGQEIPDYNGKIRIHLRNLPEAKLRDFLYGAPGHAKVLAFARSYLDDALAFDIFLHPAAEIPENHVLGENLRLGCHLSPRGVPPRSPVVIYPAPVARSPS